MTGRPASASGAGTRHAHQGLSHAPRRGTGFLALFCNLQPRWHDEFRQWLVEDMFPARLAIGFRACASYDLMAPEGDSPESGHRFLTLYETATVGELYARPYRRLRETRDARDRAFHARFQDLERYTLSWLGPEMAGGAPALAPVLHVDRFDLLPENVPAFNAWFVDRYLPACDALSGLARLRRFAAVEGRFAHLILHEFESAHALGRPEWAHLRLEDAWFSAPAAPPVSAAYRQVVERHAGAS